MKGGTIYKHMGVILIWTERIIGLVNMLYVMWVCYYLFIAYDQRISNYILYIAM